MNCSPTVLAWSRPVGRTAQIEDTKESEPSLSVVERGRLVVRWSWRGKGGGEWRLLEEEMEGGQHSGGGGGGGARDIPSANVSPSGQEAELKFDLTIWQKVLQISIQ